MVSYHRIVIKMGTSLLTGSSNHLDIGRISQLAEQIATLQKQGIEIVLVSSGAIAAGKYIMGMSKSIKDIPFRQVMAAVGQSSLMHTYEEVFAPHNITVAQALLTRADINNRASYINARNTLLALLELHIIPVINENDVIATEEIEGAAFGDNDNLSAMVTNLIDADLLVLLGDVSGLYTADPHLDPNARLIPRVETIDAHIEQLAKGTISKKGTGGMTTKIQAARLATSCGATVIITDGVGKDVIIKLVNSEPIGTLFPPITSKMESRKRWMLSGLGCSGGKVKVDSGAVQAIKSHEGSLLPVGIKVIEGSFQRGQVIDIADMNDKRIACGISNYSSNELAIIKGAHSSKIDELLGYHYGEEVVHRNNLVLV